MTRLGRLLVLIAVLLMPLGVAPVTASVGNHHAMAGMGTDHCPDQSKDNHMAGGIADCAMACSAALPAADAPLQQGLLIVSTPVAPGLQRMLSGLKPHPATPPPKHS